jgi:hypothetical protein
MLVIKYSRNLTSIAILLIKIIIISAQQIVYIGGKKAIVSCGISGYHSGEHEDESR